MTLDPREDRTALRLKLYEQGFTPLANKRKMCLLKEWPKLEVNPDLIQSRDWARSKAFMDTGIRCGDVIALDLDIDDATLMQEFGDALFAANILDESPFIRIGREPREMWIYRTSEPIGKRTTGGFAILPLAADEDKQRYAAVEVLGHGSQFGAYGHHSDGIEYKWIVNDLLDHPYMNLPSITLSQVEQVIAFAAAFFESRGMPRKTAGATMEGHYNRVYDLLPEMVFNTRDHGPMSVAELDAYLSVNTEEVLRCTMETLRPSTSGTFAGMISYVSGSVCISDHGDYRAHFPASLDDSAALTLLGELLAKRFPAPLPQTTPLDVPLADLDPLAPIDDNMAIALKRFVYVSEEDIVRDVVTNSAEGYTVLHFRNLTAQFVKVEVGSKGGEKITRLSDLWIMSPQRVNCTVSAMRPDQPYPIFEFVGERQVNTYRPMRLPAHGDPSIGFELLANLLPHTEERVWFTQWLASKIRNPASRGPGVIMVADDTYGTGRGSLISLMSDMLGEKYVRRIDFETLTGKNYQSQYNEWMTESLLVTVDEAQEATHDRARFHARQSAYEHLKGIIDPASARVEIKRKGISNSQAATFTSVFVATNHADALVIPANDRRLAVLENGQPMPAEYWVRFHHWRADPANVGAFMVALGQVDLSGYNAFGAPPMTAAKMAMIDSGASDLDTAVRRVLAAAKGGVMIREQFILSIEDYMATHSVDFPDEWQGAATRIFNKLTRKVSGDPQVSYDGMFRTPRVIGSFPQALLSNSDFMLEELAKNGPATRSIRTSGKVVDFPGARLGS